MNLGLVIYLIGIVEGVKLFCLIMGIVTTLVTIGVLFEEVLKKKREIILSLVGAVSLFFIIGIFTPNKKTIAAMYLLPKIVNNEHLKDISKSSLEILDISLEKWLGELRENIKGL